MVKDKSRKEKEEVKKVVVEKKTNPIGTVKEANISEVAQKSYLDYAMSVIVSRALPDVRDGLKPVHRRILYAMNQMSLSHTSRFSKSAKVVGEVLGKYHPHGDSSVYDALVRMAQDFSMRYCLIRGQGNFGSVDGDPPAAMRYTEVKLEKISQELLDELKKETVDFSDNFDATLKEPDVLPAKIPNVLLNGTDGIAVGMATKIPPHNLSELVDGLVFMIGKGKLEKIEEQNNGFQIKKIELDKEKAPQTAEEKIIAEIKCYSEKLFEFESPTSSEELINFVKGPDFPTAGEIYDKEEILKTYTLGKGKIPIRGKARIEERKGGKFRIIIDEIPYQVNKAELVSKIADLAREKRIVGIADLRDESDRQGIRVVIDLKRNSRPKTVLNKLYKYTPLQTTYPANLVALVDGVPQTLTLRQILLLFLRHRHEIVQRRTYFDLKAAKFRAHILEGLKIALDNLDEVIETIKKSKDAEAAKENLMKKFDLSDLQATAILDMQLRKLAALERKKIEAEYEEVKKEIEKMIQLLTKPGKMLGLIKNELLEIKEKYGDERKTKVYLKRIGEFSEEDLVPNEEAIVTITRAGYIKRLPRATFKSQRRGGKGVTGMKVKEEDEIEHLHVAETHDFLLCFTDKGRVFQVRVWDLPEGTRQAKGQAIINLINILPGEKVEAILIRKPKAEDQKYIVLATQKGLVKRTHIRQFQNIRNSGIIAIRLEKDDRLVWAKITDGNSQIILITHDAKGIRFKESDMRHMGRATKGVRGVNLKSGDYVVGIDAIPAKKDIKTKEGSRRKPFRHLLIASEKGKGKRTDVYNFPLQKRAGVGVKAMAINDKTGKLACAKIVNEEINEIILTSKEANVIRLPLKNIPLLGRATQGVILMRFKDKASDHIAAMACLDRDK